MTFKEYNLIVTALNVATNFKCGDVRYIALDNVKYILSSHVENIVFHSDDKIELPQVEEDV